MTMSLKSKIAIIPRDRLTDDRGWFLKAINGKEQGLPAHTGEVYFTSALPGKSRGGHYHLLATEWFTLLQGECRLRLRDTKTNEEMELQLSAATPATIMVPPGVAHIFENVSSDNFILMAYSSALYDPADTINTVF
jgi:dTDP-4-dehydrorhamnose 3,5-epimerase-like enzyme